MQSHIISQFQYKDFPCVVMSNTVDVGQDKKRIHYTGYVGLSKNHIYYGVHYDDIRVRCHGGLSYSDFSSMLSPDFWWIGFDVNHAYDELIPDHQKLCIENCKAIVEQLF